MSWLDSLFAFATDAANKAVAAIPTVSTAARGFAPAVTGNSKILGTSGAGVPQWQDPPASSGGAIIKQVNVDDGGAYLVITDAPVPYDDTPPLLAEGHLLLTSPSFNATKADSTIEVDAVINVLPNVYYNTPAVGHAHLNDDDADPRVGLAPGASTAGPGHIRVFGRWPSPGVGNPVVVKLAVSRTSADSSLFINGDYSARKFGGKLISSMTVREVSA